MPVMAAVSPSHARKLLESLQTDLRALSTDCKRKYPPVKDVCTKRSAKLNLKKNMYINHIIDLLGITS